MKIDVYANVYNEEKMLPYFLRHYGSFAENIYIFLDKCTDKSEEILKAHPKVKIINVEKHGIDEGYWINELYPMYEKFSRGKADFAITVAVDEFIYHKNLIEVLKKEKERGTKLIRCDGYIMVDEKFPNTNRQIYDEIKYGLPDFWSCKSAIYDPSIYIRYRPGCHSVGKLTRGVHSVGDTGIKLLHYRYLGRGDCEKRDRKNFARYYINTTPPPYKDNPRHQLPDRTRGNGHEWIAKHKPEAKNLID